MMEADMFSGVIIGSWRLKNADYKWGSAFSPRGLLMCRTSCHLLCLIFTVIFAFTVSSELLGFWFLFFSLFFVSVPCARLSWPCRQLLSARKSTVSYRIVSYRIIRLNVLSNTITNDVFLRHPFCLTACILWNTTFDPLTLIFTVSTSKLPKSNFLTHQTYWWVVCLFSRLIINNYILYGLPSFPGK